MVANIGPTRNYSWGGIVLQDGVELASQLTSAEMHADAD
jgi:hypothetical protein